MRFVADTNGGYSLIQDGSVRGLGRSGGSSASLLCCGIFGSSGGILGFGGWLFGLLTFVRCRGGRVGYTAVVEGVSDSGFVLGLGWCSLGICSRLGSGWVLSSCRVVNRSGGLGLLTSLVGGALEVLEVESELQRDKFITLSAREFDHSVLRAASGLVRARV